MCSEESECITEVLDCKHEHDEACGYTPATQGTPCTYVCEICNPQDSGETEEIEPEAACICTEPCTEDNINEDCPVCGAEDADLTACKGEPATPSNAIDPAVTDVQALIDALPTAEELERMSQDEQAAIYEQVQAAYDAYNALSDEQKAQITGAEVFDELFAVFNSMTNTLVTVGGFNVEGDSSGYSYSSGILTINNDANLTISTNGQTADRIVVASGATATITLNNVSIATTNNNTPIDVPNNSTLTLNLVNGSQNTISATSSSVTDCGSPGIHVPSGAQLTIQGEGSLSVIGASVSNGSWAGVGIGGRAVGGVQTGEACGTVIILGGNVTVSGGSGGYKTPVGIGGGGSWYGGAGGTVIILNGNVAVTGGIGRGPGASGSQSGANGQGIRPSSSGSNTYDVYGNLILPDGVTLPGNITIYIPEGASLSLPEGASWPENVTITGGGSISPKLTATITISANLDKTHDGSAVSLDSSGYTYTGDTTTPTITITWHEDNSGTIGNQLTDNAAPSAPGTYWVKVSAAETNRYAAAEATKQFTISQPLDAPTNLKWDSDTPGQATWGTVTNASGYSVQLYKGGSTQGSPVTTSGTSYDFQITEAGSYTFTVTATGSGVYSDSSPSSQSTALHTVAFDTNGGTGTISMQLVPNGGTVTEPTAPTRTGHRFDGWYSDSNFAEGSKWTFSTSTVTAATALYAKWTAIDYDITITVQGGTGNTASASVNSTTATSANMGDTVTLTATPAEGYHFVEWQVTSGGVTISEQNTFTMPAGAVAITAVFEEHTFTGWTAGKNNIAPIYILVAEGDTVISDAADAAAGTVSLTDAGNYTITLSLTDTTNFVWADGGDAEREFAFTINKANNDLSVTVENWTYDDGSAVVPSVSGNNSGAAVIYTVTGVTDTSYSQSGSWAEVKPVNAGQYTLTVSVQETDNYNADTSESVSFTISQKGVTVGFASDTEYTYTGAAVDVVLTVDGLSVDLADNEYFTVVSGYQGPDGSSYTATIAWKGNYK